MKKLNELQERFCQLAMGPYLGRPGKAYEEAGFRSKTPSQHAWKLLQSEKIKARCEEIRREQMEDIMSPGERMALQTRIARGELILEEFRVLRDGKVIRVEAGPGYGHRLKALGQIQQYHMLGLSPEAQLLARFKALLDAGRIERTPRLDRVLAEARKRGPKEKAALLAPFVEEAEHSLIN